MGIIDLVHKNQSLRYVDIETGENVSFSEMLSISASLAIDKKLAFLYLDNSLNSIKVFWNLMKSAHTIALLSPQVKLEYKINLEELYKPAYIYDPTRSEIEGRTKITFIKDLYLFETQASFSIEIHPSIKLLLSTSGTTGSPKFVKLTEDNLVQNALSIIDYLPIIPKDVAPLNLPIFYSYGLSVLTSNSIAGGIVACTNKDVLQKEFWVDFEQHGYSSLAGVPFVYEMLNRIGFTKKNYPSLRYLTQAGGHLNGKTTALFAEYARKEKIPFYVMYGQTEATARMSYLDPHKIAEKLGSIGKPIKNGKFTIDSELGELIYEGPNVYGGYATTAADLTTYNPEKRLNTGDIARVDDEGFYYVTGRLKRFVKIFGSRLNLDEIESLLKNKFIGVTFVCIGIDDKKLFIGVNSNEIEHQLISTFIVSELKLHPSVLLIQYLETIPLTANGKIDYTLIYEKYKH